MPHAANIYRLGIKELWSLVRDPIMLVLIAYTFTVSIYVAATAVPETLHRTPICIVDEDRSPLSARIAAAFYPPRFHPPAMIPLADIDSGMDTGAFTFALNIPPDFQRDVLAGKSPAIQLNVDATRMSQAFSGSNYIQQIVLDEVNDFKQRYRNGARRRVDLALRELFNPNLEQWWFGALTEIINNVTMLAVILTGAALIREARARHDRASAGDAGHPWRNHVFEGLGDGSGGLAGRCGRAAVRCAGRAARADRRFCALIPGRHRDASLRGHFPGDLHGHAGTLDATVRNARGTDLAALAITFGRIHAARKYATIRAECDAGRAYHALRDTWPSHPLPRCRPWYRVAAVPGVMAGIGSVLFAIALHRFRKTISQTT